MLEAVNSVVSNAPLLKVNTDNTRIDKGVATSPEAIQKLSVSAPYISPYVYVTKGEAVLQIRDNNTGDVQRQIPKGVQNFATAQAATVQKAEAQIVSSASSGALTSAAPQRAASATPPQVQTPVTSQSAATEYAATAAAVTNTAPPSGGEVSVLT
jgi:hypothetical protein|tara:strand:+ start:297852 stop:298316 length:465 start_codon:yes stop_codon:yes gene_type:complete